MKEEIAVAASIVLNLYNDVENLLTHAGTYITHYQALYAQYRDVVEEGIGRIPEEQRKPLIDLSAALKVLIYRTYVRAKTLAKQLGIPLPEELTKAYQKIYGESNKENLILLHPKDLTNYVEAIYNFTADATVRDLMKASRDIFKELGG